MYKSLPIILLLVCFITTFATLATPQSSSGGSSGSGNSNGRYLYSIYEMNITNKVVAIFDLVSNEFVSNVTINSQPNLDIFDIVRINEDGNVVLLLRNRETTERAMYEVDVKTGSPTIIGQSILNKQYFEYEYFNLCYQGNIAYSFYNNQGTKLMLGVWNFETGEKTYISLVDVDEELDDRHLLIPGFNYKDGTMYIAYKTIQDTTNVITLNPNNTQIAPVLYKDIVGFNSTIANFLYTNEVGQLYAACYTLEYNNTGLVVEIDLDSLSAETVVDNISLGLGDWRGVYYTPVSLSGDKSNIVFIESGLTDEASEYKMTISVYDLSASNHVQTFNLYNYWYSNETDPSAQFFRYI